MKSCYYCSEKAKKKYTVDGKVFCSKECAEDLGYSWSDKYSKLLKDAEPCACCCDWFPSNELEEGLDGDLYCPDCYED